MCTAFTQGPKSKLNGSLNYHLNGIFYPFLGGRGWGDLEGKINYTVNNVKNGFNDMYERGNTQTALLHLALGGYGEHRSEY